MNLDPVDADLSSTMTGVPEWPDLGVDGDGSVPLERRVLRLWRIRGAVTVSGAVIAAVVVARLAGANPITDVAVAISGAIALGMLWWWTALVWRSWQFRIDAEALFLRHGVLTRSESTIPFHRVQHIDTEAGPLERRLGLTTIVLRTASSSTDSKVPGIDAEDAVALRRCILALVGVGDAT